MSQSKSLILFLIITSHCLAIKNLQPENVNTANQILPNSNQPTGLIPVTQDWKQAATTEFNTSISVLQKIIFDAESPEQIADFASKFENQKTWFDKTLRSSKYSSDEYFNKIANKNARLDFLVNSIKKADAVIGKCELSEVQKKYIRLKLLYDINSLQTKKALSDENIRSLVISTTEKVVGKKYTAFPELNLAKIQFAEKIESVERGMLDFQITNRELLNKFSNLKNQNNECATKVELTEQIYNSSIKEQSSLFKNELINAEEQKNKAQINLEILEKEGSDNITQINMF